MNDLALVERSPKSTNCKVVEWRPVDGNPSLVGRVTVTFSGGWTITGIPIFRRGDGTLSAGTPSMPLLAPDGTHLRDDNGKRRYAAVIRFENHEARCRWDDAIIGALRDAGIGGSP